MLPTEFNIDVYQGDTFELTMRLKRRTALNTLDYVDLTDADVKAQVRLLPSTGSVAAEFATDVPDQTLEGNLGMFTVSLTPTQTRTLPDGWWDVEVTFPDTKVRTYLRGTVTVLEEITRA